MIRIDLKRYRREIIGAVIVLLILIGGISVFKYSAFISGFEIVDDLGGNIFPSAILSVATTDAQVITPTDSMYLGNPKSCIAIRVKSRTAYSRVRIEVAETPKISQTKTKNKRNTYAASNASSRSEAWRTKSAGASSIYCIIRSPLRTIALRLPHAIVAARNPAISRSCRSA